ncbi:MAG: primase protein [Parcubacteria group bacterium GW2011_GWC1_38_6]|nr:MAG: primase protein [Parcubacteria group bacterium GW2011_GWC1_38_6]
MLNSPIDEIKSRLDIIEVLGSYIKLQKAGANFRAVCPFHSEKKPSFFVSPVRQIWHCFGCHKGGDFFKFVMLIENVEFGDALRILAHKAGVELKRERPEIQTKRKRLYDICELACKFFEKQLEASSVGKEARQYLIGRKVKEESISEWRVGYAPESWQGLLDFLVSKGYKREEMEEVGLAIRKEGGGHYDRFRSRIIFPIFDLNSQVIGFGGRIFGKDSEKEVAKYMNSPATLLYDKSRVLYGLNKSKMTIRKEDTCILVEGYMDFIMAFQSGFQNVVATSGTALTPYQLKIIKRYSENLLTAFDMDVAGDSATKRSIDLAQMQGFNIKVITMPKGSDPADVLAEDKEVFANLVSKAKSIMEFYFDNAIEKADPKTPEGKKIISKFLLPVIKKIQNKIEQSFWVQKLAKQLDVKEEVVLEELAKTKLEEDTYGLEPEEVAQEPIKTRRELLEERLVVLVLKFPKSIEFVQELTSFSEKIRDILAVLKEGKNDFKENDYYNREAITGSEGATNYYNREAITGSEGATDYYNYLALKAEVEEIPEKDLESEIKLCLKEIKAIDIKKKLDEISKSLKEAENKKDAALIESFTQEFNNYSKALYDLELN